MTQTGTFTWTASASTSVNSSSTQSASATIGGPSFAYTGDVEVVVYWDTVFGSYLFAIP
jgi:hypothetical protein